MPKVGLPSLSHWMECGRVTSQRIYAEYKVGVNLQCLKRDLGPWPIQQREWAKSHACTQFNGDFWGLLAGCSQLLSRFKSWLDSKRWTPDQWDGSEWTKKGHGFSRTGTGFSLRYMKGDCPYVLNPIYPEPRKVPNFSGARTTSFWVGSGPYTGSNQHTFRT